MTKFLWIAEKKTLAEAVAKVLPGTLADHGTHLVKGDHAFVALSGHAFEQAMPDHYLGDDVPISAASGRKVWRMVDLPVVPDQWVIFPMEKNKARLGKLAELLRSCEVVYHLGDPGAEGQLLVDEALHFYGNTKPVKRVLVNDYNESKVKQAVANARANDEAKFQGWYRWALARSHYDWLVGLNGTRAMTMRGRELGYDGLLPVGSVQTPLLYIWVERDKLIESFKPIPYFTLSAAVAHANGLFRANWKPSEDQAGLDEEGRLTNAAVAEALTARLTGKPGRITAYAKTKKQERAPLPMSLNELQIEGFKHFGYSGAEVLKAAQELYSTYQVTTYPRSENRYLSLAAHADASRVMAAVFKVRPDLAGLSSVLDASRKSAAFDDAKMDGQDHHGVIPAVPEGAVDPKGWTDAERNVYDLIVRSYLAQFASPYEFMHTVIGVDVDGEKFSATGKTPVAEGWKAVYAEVVDEDAAAADTKGDDKQTLPTMTQGDAVTCTKCESTSRNTTPPPRFDEALALAAMANIYKFVDDPEAKLRLKLGTVEDSDDAGEGVGVGIGTPATRASITADLRKRNLVIPVKEGSKKEMTSPAARTLIEALPMSVKDPARAGIFKATLDKVASGELSYEDFMRQTVEWVTDVVAQARTATMKLPLAAGATLCPKCKSGVLRRKEGEKGAYWYCGNWNHATDKCDARYQDANGKPLTTDIPCPTCKDGHLRRKVGANGAYWFCSNWNRDPNKCEAKFEDKAGRPDTAPKPVYRCPTCKEGALRSLKGKTGLFWGCSRYEQGCKATFPDKAGKPDTAPKPVYKCTKCKVGELRSIPGPKGAFWGCTRFKEGCKATFPDKAGKPDLAAKPRTPA